MTSVPRRQTIVLGALAALTPLSIDMYLPALPALGKDVGASVEQAAQSVSIFLVGLAIGQLISGPLSDRFGRKPLILIGLATYVIASITAAQTDDFRILLAGRLAQALGASSVWVAGRASVRDLLEPKEVAQFLSVLALISGIAPILAPVIGAALLLVADWRAIFWLMAAYGVAAMLGVASFGESRSIETANHARNETPFQAYGRLLRNRTLLGYLLAAMLNSGAFLAYVANSSVVLVSGYGLTPMEFSVVFAINAGALVGAALINRSMLKTRSVDHMLRLSSRNALILGAFLLLFAETGIGGIWSLTVLLFFMAGSRAPVQANAIAAGMAIDPRRAGSISALFGSATFAAGAAASWVSGILFDGTGEGLALVIGICLLGTAASIYLVIPRARVELDPGPTRT